MHRCSYTKQPWLRFITSDNQPLACPESMDLLDKLLKYDHRERLTAHEAQAHVYFSELFLSNYAELTCSRFSPLLDSVRLEATSTKGESISDSGFCST